MCRFESVCQYTLITYKLIFLLLLNTPTPTMFTPTTPQLVLPVMIITQDGEAQFNLRKQFSVFYHRALSLWQFTQRNSIAN